MSATSAESHSSNGHNENGNGAPHGLGSPRDIENNAQSLLFLESLYEQYLTTPDKLSSDWRDYFEQLDLEQSNSDHRRIRPQRKPFSIFNPPSMNDGGLRRPQRLEVAGRQERLDQLIRNFRVRGHILAEIDPLGKKRGNPPELKPEFYGFTEEDMDRRFSTSWMGGPEVRTLRQIVQWLRTTYCRSIGVQFMHIDSLRVREWLQTRMETTGNRLKLKREQQVRILSRLSDAVLFEQFVQKKFIGEKTFSLEGAESLIPLLDMAINKAGDEGADEIVIGMAHRGRLNVLANILHKSHRQIFREFVDNDPELNIGRGDVKYHLGYSSDWFTPNGKKVHLSLCFNPSHLEYINPVAQGRLRSKMDRYRDFKHERGMTVMIHGDAAFIGEGVVQETLNLSELPGYSVGGTLHVVVNNQIGFTTTKEQSRSSTYATDVAKMLQIPIFHVNGEDPEAVAQVVGLALDFRRTFHRDVIIDMYCFRKLGHNESDEPEFTQPIMYSDIKKRQSVFESYLDQLLGMRGITREEAEQIVEQRRQVLEAELEAARRDQYIRCIEEYGGYWYGYRGGSVSEADDVDTYVKRDEVERIMNVLTDYPADFHPHRKLIRQLEQRREMGRGERPIDWASAELLAFGSVVSEGRALRMTGQDVERGTFSQRHAVLHDVQTGETFLPLRKLAPDDGLVELYNSPLSENGVLGFEYGYSLDFPDGLVIWEAQFGDFCNSAQVYIDQFIASTEDKWHRFSGLVMMLPHGFEGQGPEHSSARLERFLMLAAEDNIQIVVPSTPAQHFHVLRRQVLRKWKKPLIMMTPKSLLRHPQCVSSVDDLATGSFQSVIDDPTFEDRSQVKRILLCSGKVYYDLLAERERLERTNDVAIVRLEELYPLPYVQLQEVLGQYPVGTEVRWVQEEPENMGASRFLRAHFGQTLFDQYPLRTVERHASASPATGSKRSHQMEQASLMEAAFALF
ncbi:2-oxoglutarate dehydrogenase E1 component [Rubinisphaera brasiliensis]|uniref:oxoglutarate dehydrogenase (succinyl-transferring) n=1 Tax=Rubinisphaera brasiliensis (strain ATCC 49424 / DSM 5305 / JCM 21570 / IAM 15109 / NBRC 103401 / IFAM 1448) TaxID=756272 RepID=F0SGX1_RUBBR|nr:2-oxoglutarate dehydrogenase E1 component [Rubinisphaera brasiliensis]ADY58406.1 2-oxoglutarate dehydrogenase E1 component [Rubinisphaera brasiliensis DSM 5305]